MSKNLFQHFLPSRPAILLILVGTIVWSLTMVKSGLVYDYGMGFWGPNGHDGIWHISVIENLATGSLDMPVFAGELLRNYHIGFDLIVAFLHKITAIPVVNLYFQVIPPILAFLVGLLTYKFVYLWKKSHQAALWATFFAYFAGGWGWAISLFRSGEIGGESLFWSQQAISTLINPPFALSLVLVLLGLILLMKKRSRGSLIVSIIIFGSLIQIKAYAGLLALGGLLAAILYSAWLRKSTKISKVFIYSAILSVVLFLPMNSQSSNLLVWKPFWFLETMMGFSDRLGWDRYYSAMTNYVLGREWIKAGAAYSLAFLIFWYGNMGTRILKELSIYKWIRNYKRLTWVEIFIMAVILAGGVIPMFFLQKGTPWNTIQFFYYSLFFSGIVAGIAFSELIRRRSRQKKFIYVALLILLTIPTTHGALKHYLPSRPPAKLSNQELSALKFLSEQPEGVVLTFPYDDTAAKAAESSPPRSLGLYESTAYVSAFAKKPVYLEDQINLDITGYDWLGRRKSVVEFLETSEVSKAKNFLSDNNIKYVYWTIGQKAKLREDQLGLNLIYENEEARVFKLE